MQDNGIDVEEASERSSMENSALLAAEKLKNSVRNSLDSEERSCQEGGTVGANENRSVIDENQPLAQDLPENISSKYENICLDYEERPDKCSNDGENASDDNDRVSDSRVDTTGSTEVTSNKIPEAVEQKPMTNLNGSASPELLSSTKSDFRGTDLLCRANENQDEGSIEDSCEPPAAISHETIKKEPVVTVEKPKTLVDDSRLVKMSLPTGSLNIMQSNAQFLNKSRNFLNFITEKSTNIMERTLLPQNIAGRYNSMLKMPEGSPTFEKKKKIVDETPIVTNEPLIHSTFPVANDIQNIDVQKKSLSLPREINENSTDLQNAESVAGPKANLVDPILREPEALISDSASPEKAENHDVFEKTLNNIPSAIANEGSPISTMSAEINAEEGKNLAIPEINDSSESTEVTMDSSNSLLRHPVYLTLVRDYAKVREEKIKLADKLETLEARNRILEAQNSHELFNVQLEALEKTVERLTVELRAANANQEELGREYSAANKERESMVMKYAVSEKQLIDTQRARDFAEGRYKEIAKNYEVLQSKLRQGQIEKTRMCNIIDAKCREVSELQKEVERLKEDVNVRDAKLQWTQTKLKTEMDGHKETQSKLEKTTTRINDMKEECEQIRRESQETIRKFQQSEENKAVTLDHQLKEQQARLILERHVTEDKEILRLQLQKEVDQLKNRQQALIEENNTLSLKIQDLEKNRLTYESKLSDLKILADQRQKEIVDLSAKVSHLETLKLQLIHKEQCLVSNESEVERLRQVNQELQADMDCCRQREAHMLDFTQKLTDKNVRLQSEFTAIEAKTAQLEQEQGPLRQGIKELEAKVKTLEESLAHERKKRTEECEILARHLAEQTQNAQNLGQKLEESQGELAVLRRKQQISVKELTRELQQCRKRLEAYETASPSNSLDPTSRTGSSTSLNTGETLNGAASDTCANGEILRQSTDLDKQSLIDRILKMQKINVKRAEKVDFLEEHTRTLVAELQKKTKIIQNYILHENFDAMGSNERDRHKAELARYGGIMASVYSHRVSDDNMTLELSLEINQKLQAVLEDALLKNITLKDNIDTLGEEIARLTIMNQQMLQQKGK